MPCKQLKFYDLKARKSFITDDYEIVKNKKGQPMAVTTSTEGNTAYRLLKR